jgi:hypothetical protein
MTPASQVRKRRGPARIRVKVMPLERHDQAAWFDWLLYLKVPGVKAIHLHAFAVPNGHLLGGGKRQRVLQAMNERRQGVRVGVPDVYLDWPVAPYHGLRIEFKRIGARKPGPDQIAWQARNRLAGYCSEVCYGFEAAKVVTLTYLGVS